MNTGEGISRKNVVIIVIAVVAAMLIVPNLTRKPSEAVKGVVEANVLPNGKRNASPAPLLEEIKTAADYSGYDFQIAIVSPEEFPASDQGYSQERLDSYVMPLYEGGDYVGFYFVRLIRTEADGPTTTWYSAYVKKSEQSGWEKVAQ